MTITQLRPEIITLLDHSDDELIIRIAKRTNGTRIQNIRKLIRENSPQLCLPHFQKVIIEELNLKPGAIIYEIININ